ncbi:MAG TPA: DUF5691 domain-containing protein [Trebonia sp.]|jgi:hypothetical protein
MTGNTASFDDLVTAATVGVARKPLPLPGDPAGALLDAAARETVARRAGYQPLRGAPAPEAPAETAPALSSRAARALREACDWKPGRGFPADSALLPDLLTAAAQAGYVAPALLLPDLLDAAVRRGAGHQEVLRPAVASVLGARGQWLARQRPDWAQLGEQRSAAGAAGPETWTTGRSAQRVAYVRALRDTDAGAARELLAAGWSRESGVDRAQLIAVLERGLSAADEEFLEAALDDRASGVRVVARRLLGRLPGSAFRRRASERAEGVLRLEQRVLVAARPGLPDAAALRDGINVSPPASSIGSGAWRLTQVIAAAPLGGWTERFGLRAREIAALPVHDGLAADVRAGWRLAAVREADAEWARALLAPSGGAGGPGTDDDGRHRPPSAWPPDRDLAAVLPPGERAGRAADLLTNLRLTAASPPGWGEPASPPLAEIAGLPVPWPEVLADAVVDVVDRAVTMAVMPGVVRTLLPVAARGLPATGPRDYAAVLARLADAYPQAWPATLRATAYAIACRRVFLQEIGHG